MAYILQVETSTQSCSVALSQNGTTIATKEALEANIHASRLTLFIEEVMQGAGLSYDQLDAVAVSKGPGSYTGLRIGVSTAKGLCFAIDKPLIGIDSLSVMASRALEAAKAYGADALLCPMIDARRMEVYTAIYSQGLEQQAPVIAKIVDEHSYAELLDEGRTLLFFGDGAAKCTQVINHPHAILLEGNFNQAAGMSTAAYEAFTSGLFEDVAYFEPFYLKDFVVTSPKKKS